MPVKAYRVIDVVYDHQESFNHILDQKLMEFLDEKHSFFVMLDNDGVGFVIVSTEALKEALEKVGMTEGVRAALNRDIVAGYDTGFVRYMVIGS